MFARQAAQVLAVHARQPGGAGKAPFRTRQEPRQIASLEIRFPALLVFGKGARGIEELFGRGGGDGEHRFGPGKQETRGAVAGHGQPEGPFDGVLELAHVARPIVRQERLDLLRRDLGGVPRPRPKGIAEHLHQEGDVFAAIPEGGHGDHDHRQAVKQIFPESATADLFVKVPFRGREDAHVDIDRAVAADAPDRVGVEGAEQLGLDREREFSDLVQEKCSAVRPFERADPPGFRAGERAAFVAEQLRLHQAGGDRPTVDRHPRSIRAGRGRVDRAGQDVFAGPRFPEDQGRGRRGGDRFRDAEDLAHREGPPLHGAEPGLRRGQDFDRCVAFGDAQFDGVELEAAARSHDALVDPRSVESDVPVEPAHLHAGPFREDGDLCVPRGQVGDPQIGLRVGTDDERGARVAEGQDPSGIRAGQHDQLGSVEAEGARYEARRRPFARHRGNLAAGRRGREKAFRPGTARGSSRPVPRRSGAPAGSPGPPRRPGFEPLCGRPRSSGARSRRGSNVASEFRAPSHSFRCPPFPARGIVALVSSPTARTMVTVEISQPGEPEVLRAASRPVPAPGPGEVLIRVHAAGVNRPDTLQRRGFYPPPPGASDIPGLEVSGRVVEVGPGAEGVPGDAVCALVAGGGYAEWCVAPAVQCLPVPAAVPLLDAAGLPETVFTVWANVFERGGLRPEDTLLVHGGSSGIGTTAIQMARAFGARVFTTAGSDARCRRCEALGADMAVNYRTEDFVERVGEATAGRGVNVVLDMVGGDYVARNIACMAEGGRHVSIAALLGATGRFPIFTVMQKRLTLTGSTLRARSVEEKGRLAAVIRERVWPWLETGALRSVVSHRFALEEAAEAHRTMEASEHFGKILLVTEAADFAVVPRSAPA